MLSAEQALNRTTTKSNKSKIQINLPSRFRMTYKVPYTNFYTLPELIRYSMVNKLNLYVRPAQCNQIEHHNKISFRHDVQSPPRPFQNPSQEPPEILINWRGGTKAQPSSIQYYSPGGGMGPRGPESFICLMVLIYSSLNY